MDISSTNHHILSCCGFRVHEKGSPNRLDLRFGGKHLDNLERAIHDDGLAVSVQVAREAPELASQARRGEF